MFHPFIGACKFCTRTNAPIVVKSGACDKCRYEQKQSKKKAEGKKPSKSFKSYSYKEPTGEAELFERIAEEREWVCFVTGEPLRELTPTNFLHVLPKALNRYPKYKLYDKNIVLGTADAHFKWDKTPRSELKKDKRFDKLFALESELLAQYPEIK